MKKLSVLFFICCYTFVSGQNNENKNAYVLFDAIIGQKNLEINVGVKYIEKYRTLKNEHQFFKAKKLQSGTISFNQQEYHNIPLMYDLYTDELIINIQSQYDSYLLIVDRKKVASFNYGNHFFKKINNEGYFQLLSAQQHMELVKKTKKYKKKRIANNSSISKFVSESSYHLLKDQQLTSLSNRQDWIHAFPAHKSLIKQYYKTHRKTLKSNLDHFVTNLFNTLNSL